MINRPTFRRVAPRQSRSFDAAWLVLATLLITHGLMGPVQGQAPAAPCNAPADTAVLCGIDELQRAGFEPLRGKRVGLITNHTGIAHDGTSTVQLLHQSSAVNLVRLFSPEHGIAGKLDIAEIHDARDESTGLKIFSLYGQTRRPSAESLQDIDVLVFDIQDIGTRFYTYISTMGNAMRAAAEQGVAFMVLDRPNPINGVDVQGPVLDAGTESFVGYHTIPVRHGMTVGELARLFRAELELDLNLTVIKVKGWQRQDFFDQTGLLWVNPSPNMRCLNQALLYPGVGLLETTNLSVGRGTDTPFEIVGAPWIDPQLLAAGLNSAQLGGVRFVPLYFTPDASKYAHERCGGVSIVITSREHVQPMRIGWELARQLRSHYAEQWQAKSYHRLLCDQATWQAVMECRSVDTICQGYQAELRRFWSAGPRRCCMIEGSQGRVLKFGWHWLW